MTYMITTARNGRASLSDSILALGLPTMKLARKEAYWMVTTSNRYRSKADRVAICDEGQVGRVKANANVFESNGAVFCATQKGSIGVFGLTYDGSMHQVEGRKPSATIVHPYLTTDAYWEYDQEKGEEAIDRELSRREDGYW